MDTDSKPPSLTMGMLIRNEAVNRRTAQTNRTTPDLKSQTSRQNEQTTPFGMTTDTKECDNNNNKQLLETTEQPTISTAQKRAAPTSTTTRNETLVERKGSKPTNCKRQQREPKEAKN